MEGGTAKISHCNDSDKCLKVVADTPVTISRDNALKSQITKLLASIQNKAVSDTPLDDKEKGFISSTTIPVFKYLVDPQMLGVSNSMIYQLTDYIGYRSVSMQRVRLQRHNRKWPGRRRTEPKVPCMVSAAVLPVPGTHSVSLALTGGAVTLSLVVLTAR